MKIKNKYFILVFFIGLAIISCDGPTRDLNPKTLEGGFELLASDKTGIDFNNSIKESKFFNHYYYGHIYIGSGVMGDLGKAVTFKQNQNGLVYYVATFAYPFQ